MSAGTCPHQRPGDDVAHRVGDVRVVDALAVGRSGRLPWTELLRQVEGVEGSVPMRWAVRPGPASRPCALDRAQARLRAGARRRPAPRRPPFDVGEEQVDHRRCPAASPPHRVPAACSPSPAATTPRSSPRTARTRGAPGGDRGPLAAVVAVGAPRRAVGRRRPRSALALKQLLPPTGAMAAAPTTSLPERIGGDKNWDYRYMWVRDTSFAADAMINLAWTRRCRRSSTGCWAPSAARPRPARVLQAGRACPGGQQELKAPGYRGSRPVRSGNGAATQTQLGCFGDLFDTVLRYVGDGHLLDPGDRPDARRPRRPCCDIWLTEDSGIWELGTTATTRSRRWAAGSRWTARCSWPRWARSPRARRPLGAGGGRSRAWVDEHCWSEAKRSYTFYAGTEDLDAATLLAGRTGFDRGERLAGTIRAVREELGRGPLLYRYSGMDGRRAASWPAPSGWSRAGDAGRAGGGAGADGRGGGAGQRRRPAAEQMDPATGEMLGNFPQALAPGTGQRRRRDRPRHRVGLPPGSRSRRRAAARLWDRPDFRHGRPPPGNRSCPASSSCCRRGCRTSRGPRTWTPRS